MISRPTLARIDEREFESLRPGARHDALIRRYDDGTLAWSPISAEPTLLDPVSDVVLQLLDGEASIADLVSDVHEVVGVPQSVARDRLRRTIDILDRAGLLTGSVEHGESVDHLHLFSGPSNP